MQNFPSNYNACVVLKGHLQKLNLQLNVYIYMYMYQIDNNGPIYRDYNIAEEMCGRTSGKRDTHQKENTKLDGRKKLLKQSEKRKRWKMTQMIKENVEQTNALQQLYGQKKFNVYGRKWVVPGSG